MATDRYELFKRLCVGAEFDRKQLKRDNFVVQGKSAVVDDLKEGGKDLSALDFFGDSLSSFSTEGSLDSMRKRSLGDHDINALNPKRCKKKLTENIKKSNRKYKIKRYNDSIVNNDLFVNIEGRVGDSVFGEGDDGEKVKDEGEDDRSDVGDDDDGDGEGEEDDRSDDGEDEENEISDDGEDDSGGSGDDRVGDSGDDGGEEGGNDVQGCSDDIERDEDGGISLFRGQSLIPSRKERRKTSHKKRHSSKRKLEEIELRKQEMNAFRNAHKIHVLGSDIPDVVDSFERLAKMYGILPVVMKNVQTAGYAMPTPIQMQAIPLMLQNREILACAPTGSGKTAAYILPILHHLKSPKKVGFRAVILAPTRELAQQIYREFLRLSAGAGFKIHVLTKANATSDIFTPWPSMKFDILVATPNRLVHMLKQQPPTISLGNVQWLIIDEADKLFEEGTNSFRDQIADIYAACNSPDVKHAMFSATLGSGVEEFIKVHFESPVRVVVGLQNAATETVQQELLFVGQEAGKLMAMRDIVKKGFEPPVLVFVQSIERAKELFHELIYDGINVEVIHAERTQAQRDNIVKAFRSGKIWVLICTDLMGRGIDFKGVNTVINYDFPTSAIAYIHRIGRTGRAGRSGRAVTFFTEDDAVNLRSIANVMKHSGCEVPDWMLTLKKPSKKAKKKLVRNPTKRDNIKTASKYDLKRTKKKKEMIQASMRKKLKSRAEDNQQ